MKIKENDLLEDLKIQYSAVFVPFSQSRNKDNKDKSLNWTVTLERNNVTLTTDYMQGIAHHPDYNKYHKHGMKKLYEWELYRGIVQKSTETGKRHVERPFGITKGNLPIPEIKEVLWSLIMDLDVLQHDSFESWAGDFGYEKDSRSAEKIYQACLKIALKVNLMFSTEEREQLQEFYQDY